MALDPAVITANRAKIEVQPMDQLMIGLRNVLADLYPTREDSVRLVGDAGLPRRFIRFDDVAVNNWASILEEAQKRGMVPAIISAALQDYPENEQLKQADRVLQQGAPGIENTSVQRGESGSLATTEQPPILVVLIEYLDHRGHWRGFVSSRGYVITLAPDGLRPDTELTVSWTANGQDERRVARLDRLVGPGIALLQVTDMEMPRPSLPTRNSTSLRPGDGVEGYLGPNDRSPGTVIQVGVERKIGSRKPIRNLLLTTTISGGGDMGAPVIDENERVVGVILAEGVEGTLSVPIEEIRPMLVDAF